MAVGFTHILVEDPLQHHRCWPSWMAEPRGVVVQGFEVHDEPVSRHDRLKDARCLTHIDGGFAAGFAPKGADDSMGTSCTTIRSTRVSL